MLNPRGAERAVAAGCDELGYVIVASETFSSRNQGRSIEDNLADWRRVVGIARAAGRRVTATIAAAFGCSFEGMVAPGKVAALAQEVMADGPDEIALADTIGVGVPSQVLDLFGRVRAMAPELTLRAHFHKHAQRRIRERLRSAAGRRPRVDASVGGIGGCPSAPRATGNITTEDLVYLLDGLGVATGVDGPVVAARGVAGKAPGACGAGPTRQGWLSRGGGAQPRTRSLTARMGCSNR